MTGVEAVRKRTILTSGALPATGKTRVWWGKSPYQPLASGRTAAAVLRFLRMSDAAIPKIQSIVKRTNA